MLFRDAALLALLLAYVSTNPAQAQDTTLCLDSQVSFETSTLEKIVRHPEQVIETGGSFWQDEKPMYYTQRWAEDVNVGIPYMRWWNQVQQLTELSDEERSRHPLLIMTDSIIAVRDMFAEAAIPHICSFLPDSVDISIPVYFTAFVPPRSFVSGGVVINVSASYWKGDVQNILNNLTHEIFHVGYSHLRPSRTEAALEDDQLYGMLDALQNEGMATYVGYRAMADFPAPDELDYPMLEDPGDVERLLNEINDLFQQVGEVSGEELQRLSWRKGVTDRGYYVVGAHMAETIDSQLGRAALIGTLKGGPVSFVTLYNTRVEPDRQIRLPEM